jgi:hypothetical protein
MESIETNSALYFPSGEVLLCHFSTSERLFLHDSPPLYVHVYIRSLHSFVRTYKLHRQHRRSSKECYATSSRRFGLPFGTSDSPLPLHWAESVATLRRDLNPRSRSSCPQSSENPMWLPRALSCPATPVRSAFSQIRTRVPSHPVGLSLHPTLLMSCQALRHHSLLLVLLLT